MNARRAHAKASKKAAKEGKKHKLAKSTASQFKAPTVADGLSSSSSSSGDNSPDGGESAAKKAKKTPTAFDDQKGGKMKGAAVAGTSGSVSKMIKTVQDDPTKSEVYKRLFSSHKTALNQPKGHWVTFDPRYN